MNQPGETLSSPNVADPPGMRCIFVHSRRMLILNNWTESKSLGRNATVDALRTAEQEDEEHSMDRETIKHSRQSKSQTIMWADPCKVRIAPHHPHALKLAIKH